MVSGYVIELVGFVAQEPWHVAEPAVTFSAGSVFEPKVGVVADACTFQPALLFPPVYATVFGIVNVFVWSRPLSVTVATVTGVVDAVNVNDAAAAPPTKISAQATTIS